MSEHLLEVVQPRVCQANPRKEYARQAQGALSALLPKLRGGSTDYTNAS